MGQHARLRMPPLKRPLPPALSSYVVVSLDYSYVFSFAARGENIATDASGQACDRWTNRALNLSVKAMYARSAAHVIHNGTDEQATFEKVVKDDEGGPRAWEDREGRSRR